MKDTKKILRHAVFNALSGNITYDSTQVPISDEKARTGNTADIFIVLTGQQETPMEENSCAWVTRSSIEMEIRHKSGSEVSKDAIDDIYEDILEIIFPTISTIGLTVPSGFQFQNGRRDTCITNPMVLTETESVLAAYVKLSFDIVQQ